MENYAYGLDNPFNFEFLNEEYPIRTAEEIEAYGGYQDLPVFATIDTYMEAGRLQAYVAALKDAVRTGRVGVNRQTEKVPHPDCAEVERCLLHHMECTRIENEDTDCIYADAVIIADIDIYQKMADHDGTAGNHKESSASSEHFMKDRVTQWYRVYGVLDPKGRNNSVGRVEIYDKWKRRRGRKLSEYLIPIISESEMDKEAERILEHYGMGEAVSKCMPVDIQLLASKAGLHGFPAKLSIGGKVQSELYLHDCNPMVYGKDGTPAFPDVTADSVLIDFDACGSEEAVREAEAHETAHKVEHSIFYWLQRKYTDNISFISMIDWRYADNEAEDAYELLLDNEDDTETDGPDEKTPLDWGEWQARMLGPRFLMPATQTRKKIRYLIGKHKKPGDNMAETYTKVIPELASFYKVTIRTARKRMIQLGFADAKGALNWVDGHYVPAYTTTSGYTRKGRSYTISSEDVQNLYETDLTFRAVADSGAFVFAENHYCLNDPRYVQDGTLTQEARSHIDRCCILFTIRNPRHRMPYDKEALHNDDWKNDPIAVALAALPIEAFMGASSETAKECDDLPRRFGKTLTYHREQAGLSQEELAWQAGISDKQLRRLENDEIERPSQQIIAELGRAMKLKGCFTMDMMEKAGCGLHRDIPEEMVLSVVVNYMYMRTREECNRVLLSRHCKPLGGRNSEKLQTAI